MHGAGVVHCVWGGVCALPEHISRRSMHSGCLLSSSLAFRSPPTSAAALLPERARCSTSAPAKTRARRLPHQTALGWLALAEGRSCDERGRTGEPAASPSGEPGKRSRRLVVSVTPLSE